MQMGKSTVGLEGLDRNRGQCTPEIRGQIERLDIYSQWKNWEMAWCMVPDLGWGQLVSTYMTLLCPCHLQVGQSGVSKMAVEERAEPGDGLPAQASLPLLPTVAHVTISSVFPAAWRAIHTSHGLRCFLTVAH